MIKTPTLIHFIETLETYFCLFYFSDMYRCLQCGCDFSTSRLDFICSRKCQICYESRNAGSESTAEHAEDSNVLETAALTITVSNFPGYFSPSEQVAQSVLCETNINPSPLFQDKFAAASDTDSCGSTTGFWTSDIDQDNNTWSEEVIKTYNGDHTETDESDFPKTETPVDERSYSSCSSSPEHKSSSDSEYEATNFPDFYRGIQNEKLKYCDSYLNEVRFEEIGKTDEGKKPYRCKPCNLIFFSKAHYKNHNLMNKDKDGVQCTGITRGAYAITLRRKQRLEI